MIAVIQACTCSVCRRPSTWIAANARIKPVATIRSSVTMSMPIDSWKGASRYLAEANPDAAPGPAKPIRNDTQPERNAGSGPYASRR